MQKIGLSGKDANDALVSLANSGKFFGDEMAQAALGIANFATVTGTSVKEATKEFEKLADDPAKALLSITGRLNELNPAIIQTVAQLQAQGDQFQAVAVATQAATDASAKAAQAAKEHETALRDLSVMSRLAEEDETGYAKLMYEAEKAALANAEANR